MSRQMARFHNIMALSFTVALAMGATATAAWARAGERLTDEAEHYRAEGMAAQQRGDVEGAITLLQKAAHFDPSYATPHNDLGGGEIVVRRGVGDAGDAVAGQQTARPRQAQWPARQAATQPVVGIVEAASGATRDPFVLG